LLGGNSNNPAQSQKYAEAMINNVKVKPIRNVESQKEME
jgi:hypothetical protein